LQGFATPLLFKASQMKKLAPYGRHLKEMQSSGQLPNNDVYLFIGEYSWQKGKAFNLIRPTTLILPPNKDPNHFEWPVQNTDILIFDTSNTDPEVVEELIAILFLSGANIVRFVSNQNLLTVFKKEL
jgi:hypothetical protein